MPGENVRGVRLFVPGAALVERVKARVKARQLMLVNLERELDELGDTVVKEILGEMQEVEINERRLALTQEVSQLREEASELEDWVQFIDVGKVYDLTIEEYRGVCFG